jgi:hypothetical protein
MAVIELEQCLRVCVDQDTYVIQKLYELFETMEWHHTICNTVKTGGTTIGAMGTAIMVGSILTAPFTGGLSLLATGSAAAFSIGGAATNVITNRVDRKKSVQIIDEVQTLVACRDAAISQLKVHTDQFNSLLNQLTDQDISEETAVRVILNGNSMSID